MLKRNKNGDHKGQLRRTLVISWSFHVRWRKRLLVCIPKRIHSEFQGQTCICLSFLGYCLNENKGISKTVWSSRCTLLRNVTLSGLERLIETVYIWYMIHDTYIHSEHNSMWQKQTTSNYRAASIWDIIFVWDIDLGYQCSSRMFICGMDIPHGHPRWNLNPKQTSQTDVRMPHGHPWWTFTFYVDLDGCCRLIWYRKRRLYDNARHPQNIPCCGDRMFRKKSSDLNRWHVPSFI